MAWSAAAASLFAFVGARDVFLALVLTTLVSASVGWGTAAVLPPELEARCS